MELLQQSVSDKFLCTNTLADHDHQFRPVLSNYWVGKQLPHTNVLGVFVCVDSPETGARYRVVKTSLMAGYPGERRVSVQSRYLAEIVNKGRKE